MTGHDFFAKEYKKLESVQIDHLFATKAKAEELMQMFCVAPYTEMLGHAVQHLKEAVMWAAVAISDRSFIDGVDAQKVGE